MNVTNSFINNGLDIKFSKNLGHAVLESAMWGVPYKTGNLASSVKLKVNTPEKIRIFIGGRDAVYAMQVNRRGKSAGYIDRIVDDIIGIVGYYFTEGQVISTTTMKPMDGFSWSQTFYNITQEKGVGSLGERGTRFLVGRHRGETRKQRRKRSRATSSKVFSQRVAERSR